jgi:Tfp pilus assembly major pilin PilA
LVEASIPNPKSKKFTLSKSSARAVTNGVGIFTIGSVAWWFWQYFQTIPPFEGGLLLLITLIVVVAIAIALKYVEKYYGIDISSIMEEVMELIDVVKQQNEEISKLKSSLDKMTEQMASMNNGMKALMTARAPAETISTKSGAFYHNPGDAVGVYSTYTDFGRGVVKAVYLDIEKWKAAGGKTVKGSSNKSDAIVVSRFGVHQTGYYVPEENTVYSPYVDDIFDPYLKQEEGDKKLYQAAVLRSYKNFLSALAANNQSRLLDDKPMTDEDVDKLGFEPIARDIIGMGATVDDFIKTYLNPEAAKQSAPEEKQPTPNEDAAQ